MRKLFWPHIVVLDIALVILPACHSATITTLTNTETVTQPITFTQTVTTTQSVTMTQTAIVPQPTTITQTVATTICCNSTVPDDFYIIYETSWFSPDRFVTLLDTKNGVLGKPLSPNDYVSTGFYASCEYLQAIYDGLIQYDIKSYGSPDLLVDGYWVMTPRLFYKITFSLNGETYMIFCDNSVFTWLAEEKYQNLRFFKSLLDEYYRNTDEYQALPPATALPT